MPADYRYDTENDCFVVEDKNGNEICRTRSPHTSADKVLASCIATAITEGALIFPNTSEAQPQPHA